MRSLFHFIKPVGTPAERARSTSLLIGFLISLAMALFFAFGPRDITERLELYTQDLLLRYRKPMPEDPAICHIDIDDSSIGEIGQYPWPRRQYAELIRALNDFGVRVVFFDIEFESSSTEEGKEGVDDLEFARALKQYNNVILSYHFDEARSLPDVLFRSLGQIKSILQKEPGAGSQKVSEITGISRELIQGKIATLRRVALVSLILDRFDSHGLVSFQEITQYFSLNTLDPADTFTKDLIRVLQRSYSMATSIRSVLLKSARIRSMNVQKHHWTPILMYPAYTPFAESAKGSGFVDVHKDIDGLLRRRPLYLYYRNQVFLNAALEVYIKYEESLGRTVDVTIDDLAIHLEITGGTPGSPPRRLHIPTGHRAETLINWTGTPDKMAFHESRIPFAAVLKQHMELQKTRNKLSEIKNILDNPATLPKVKQLILKQYNESQNELKRLEKPFKDKICFIGSSATASGDLHPTPLRENEPGVNAISTVVNMFLTGNFLYEPRFIAPYLVTFFLTFFLSLAISIGASLLKPATAVAQFAIFWPGYFAMMFLLYATFHLLINASGPSVGMLVSFSGITVYRFGVERRSRMRLQTQLEGHTSPALVAEIMKDPEKYQKPRKVETTIFFSDVKGFTTITEEMPPETMVGYVNEYHDRMSRIILNHGAYLDKYIGDGIMAVFGVPLYQPDHALRACKAALENVGALESLNEHIRKLNLPEIDIRIGINSGEVIAGAIGSAQRSDYTVVGDNVNLAARLEGVNKEYGTKILISEYTFAHVKDQIAYREVDTVRVVGKKRSVTIYEVLGIKGTVADDSPWLTHYGAGLQAFKERDWKRAEEFFLKAMDTNGQDRLSQIYVERVQNYRIIPPPADWDGVSDMLTK